MTKTELERLTKSCLGQVVSCTSPDGFRPNAKAEIVGWCMINKKPHFTIRFQDNETTHIPADSEGFVQAGYVVRSN